MDQDGFRASEPGAGGHLLEFPILFANASPRRGHLCNRHLAQFRDSHCLQEPLDLGGNLRSVALASRSFWSSAPQNAADRILAMAEPVRAARTQPPEERPDPERAALDVADFPGCRAVRIAPKEIEDHEGRVEYWEARTGTAMVVCEPTSTYHEQPAQRLAGLTALIAASRGSPISAYGTADLVRVEPGGKPRVLMQADQILYLHPPSAEELGPRVDVDGDRLPDVVLEVDYSTDVRVRKLPLYEAWGFPEVWVDVPDARSPSRPKARRAGLTIHVLDGDRFHRAESGRAFPGWTAEEIHRALNEHTMSASTVAALHRVGAAMGAAEGTGPDDDPWLRRYRTETRYESVIAVLAERGIETTRALPARIAELGEIPVTVLVRAALRCASESEFLELCASERRRR